MESRFVSFAEVKRAVTLEAVLSRYGLLAGLKPRGDNLSGACPFCAEAQGSRFKASLAKNAWYCFGCKAGGNILDFVAKREGVSLREAAVRLEEWFDLGLVTFGREKPRREGKAAEPCTSESVTVPARNEPLAFTLKTIDPGHASVQALGLSDGVVSEFGLGYCARGLLKGRIAVPIRNFAGDLVAYIGFASDAQAGSRYRYPPKFQPALEVFNLHALRQASSAAETTFLAPEILGVLRLAETKFPFLVGLFDGSLSESQEAALLSTLPKDSKLVLAGSGFEASVFERLSRTFSLRNIALEAELGIETVASAGS